MAKPLSKNLFDTKKKREASLYFSRARRKHARRARVARRFDSHPERKSRSSAVPLRFIIIIILLLLLLLFSC